MEFSEGSCALAATPLKAATGGESITANTHLLAQGEGGIIGWAGYETAEGINSLSRDPIPDVRRAKLEASLPGKIYIRYGGRLAL